MDDNLTIPQFIGSQSDKTYTAGQLSTPQVIPVEQPAFREIPAPVIQQQHIHELPVAQQSGGRATTTNGADSSVMGYQGYHVRFVRVADREREL